MKLKDFFAPSWKKIGWFFLVLFIAQLYLYIIIYWVPYQVIGNFINFVLNPFTIILPNAYGIETQLATPIAVTLNAMWNYFLATILAKEVSKEK